MTGILGWKEETDKTGVTSYYKSLGILKTLTIKSTSSKFWGEAFGIDERGIVEVIQSEDGKWHKRIKNLALTPTGDFAVEKGDLKAQIKSDEVISDIKTIEQLAKFLESLVP